MSEEKTGHLARLPVYVDAAGGDDFTGAKRPANLPGRRWCRDSIVRKSGRNTIRYSAAVASRKGKQGLVGMFSGSEVCLCRQPARPMSGRWPVLSIPVYAIVRCVVCDGVGRAFGNATDDAGANRGDHIRRWRCRSG